MQIVALEEHWMSPRMRRAWTGLPPDRQDDSLSVLGQFRIGERLEDTETERLRCMDDIGVDVQVISLTVPGLQDFPAAEAVQLAREANDALHDVVATHPDRYQSFAALPTPNPEAAAAELQRAVQDLGCKGAMLFGRTRERNMDAPEFDVIYATAAKIGVPLYLHPQLPQRAVREAYYNGFPKPLEVHFANGGLGWHYEAGIQFMRLILSGTLDRHPQLQFILGHWGEVVLFYIDRLQILDVTAKLDRPVRDYFLQNAYYTPSGIMSQRDMRRTIETVGVERVMFSTDYPFEYCIEEAVDPQKSARWSNLTHMRHGGARRFLEEADLTQADKELIAHGNWDRLTSSAQPHPNPVTK